MEPNQRVLLQPRLQHYVTLRGSEGIDIVFINLEFKQYDNMLLKRVRRFECKCTYDIDTHSWIPINKGQQIQCYISYEHDYQTDAVIKYDESSKECVEYIYDTNYLWTLSPSTTQQFTLSGTILRGMHDIDRLFSKPVSTKFVLPDSIDVFQYRFCDCPYEELQFYAATKDKKRKYQREEFPAELMPELNVDTCVALYNKPVTGHCRYENLTAVVPDKLLPYDVPNQYDMIKTTVETYNPQRVDITYQLDPKCKLDVFKDTDTVQWSQFIHNSVYYMRSTILTGNDILHSSKCEYVEWDNKTLHDKWTEQILKMSPVIVTEVPEIPRPQTITSEPLATEVPEISDIELMRKIINQQ